MYFKIDCNKVSDMGLFLKNKSDQLDSLYNDILNICNEIEENYVSEDSTVYMAKFRKYIKIFLMENDNLRSGAYVLGKTASLYSNQEIEWYKKVLQSDLNSRAKMEDWNNVVS